MQTKLYANNMLCKQNVMKTKCYENKLYVEKQH